MRDLADALNTLLADMLGLYLKTKNFHWHISGPHFRDYHLLLDEQGDELFATTDAIAERVRKIGGTTLRSIGHISLRIGSTRPSVAFGSCLKQLVQAVSGHRHALVLPGERP